MAVGCHIRDLHAQLHIPPAQETQWPAVAKTMRYSAIETDRSFFFFNDPATTEISPLSLHAALPILNPLTARGGMAEVYRAHDRLLDRPVEQPRSEEHTSELQSLRHLVCRLLL